MGLGSGELSVTWHRHRYQLLQVERRGERWNVDLHRVFAQAPSHIIEALASYLRNHDQRALEQLECFAELHFQDATRFGFQKNATARGTFVDLQVIFDHLNFTYFDGMICAQISWLEGADWQCIDRERQENEDHALALAAYCAEERHIFVHRSLDAPDVPRVYLEWVVYHEMLHQRHDCDLLQGRDHHGPAFLADEAVFVGKPEAQQWEHDNWARLHATLRSPGRRLDG